MSTSRGKEFEIQFKEDFAKIPNSCVDRLYDTGLKRRGVRNPCDFICYVKPNIFYLECKSKEGNTFPLGNLTQYNKLLEKKNIDGAIVGVVL